MSVKVISANYRNRNSEYRWLVRDETEAIDKAVACKSVEAHGPTRFVASHEEEGFGCSVVAKTESQVDMFDVEGLKPLKFDGRGFVDREGNTVRSVQSLVLGEDGSIEAAW